ncbi:hypothetical protein TNCV_1057281 [Trichonephila clavipes]|nr:hypothetical protein TNCV_1057281 [Trichonephila clavipes]
MRVTFIDLQLLLAGLLTIGSGVSRCLREAVCPIRLGGGRSDGWKWGCHRLMLLGVLMCLVEWSTISGINIKPKHLSPEDMLQADHELQHRKETVLSLFRPEGEEGFLCCNLLQTTL